MHLKKILDEIKKGEVVDFFYEGDYLTKEVNTGAYVHLEPITPIHSNSDSTIELGKIVLGVVFDTKQIIIGIVNRMTFELGKETEYVLVDGEKRVLAILSFSDLYGTIY